MSDYYDSDKPFSIENWNSLIRAVNEILEDPPPGAINCPPVDPLEEVEDPHIWAVEDVEEMRDKLKETCPDIDFDEELVLWKEAIIDEIEEEMEKAWCDCDTEPEEEDILACTLAPDEISAARNDEDCCGTVEHLAPCAICVGSHCQEIEWASTWYPSPSPNNDPKYDIMCDTYDTAYDEVWNLIYEMNKLPPLAKSMESYQSKVDSYAAQVDSLIEQYQDECLGPTPPAQCAQIQADICAKGESARYYQDKVDQAVENYKEWHDKAIPRIEAANSAAAQNSAAALGLTGRFPTDHNVTAECFAEVIPQWPWYDWWDPSRMDKLGDTMDHHFNRASDGDGVLVEVDGYRIWSRNPYPKDKRDIRLSPNGTFYIQGFSGAIWNKSYTNTYWEWRIRWRCEPALSCNPEPGTCEFPDWPDFEKIWWNQGWPSEGSCVGSCTGFGCWIWSPIYPPDYEAQGTDDWYVHTKRQGGMEDVSEKRDEWLDEHYNWYDEHEQYDDRHESYC